MDAAQRQLYDEIDDATQRLLGTARVITEPDLRQPSLLPGWTRSPQFEAWLEKPGVGDRIIPRIPLRRWGEPEDWAGIAVYLASRASSFHTGDAFRIDGGYGVF